MTGILNAFKRLAPFGVILAFILFKLSDLPLPYYWDEAWSYLPAIKEMAHQGSSLLPNSISPDLYRGHPLLFYFLSSGWMSIMGEEIWINRIFPLLLSVFFLISVFSLARRHFGYATALLSTAILAAQSVFFAQATFLLPEILLALLTVQSFKSYLDNRYQASVLWLCMALFTKESGLVAWAVITLFATIETLKTSGITLKQRISRISVFLIPVLLVSGFFILQKLRVGWYFFPEHISYINLAEIAEKLEGYASYLLIYMGRNLLSFAGIVALIFILVKDRKLPQEVHKPLSLFGTFVVAYLLFSSVNFYSPRYLLSVLPLVIIIWVYFISEAFRKTKPVFPMLLFLGILFNSLFNTATKRGANDHTLGYRDLIAVQAEMVRFAENVSLYEKEICTHFLMSNYLLNPDLGYRADIEKKFSKVSSTFNESTEFVIFSSVELDESLYKQVKQQGRLIKRFSQRSCWTEVYRINRGEDAPRTAAG